MPAEHLIPLLRKDVPSKIVLLVMDGLGDIPAEPGGLTPLEAAHTPHLDRLAAGGALGRTTPVRQGVTPGSGPAHLAMFGYDPLTYLVGRGVMEALGIGMQVGAGDVAVRGNFCTLDAAGSIIDRRAGRISSEEAAPIIELLQGVQVPGMTAEVQLVKEYRFALVLRGAGLQGDIEDTDPQVTGQPPLPAAARSQGSQKTAELVNTWIAAAHQALANQPKANGITLRGFGGDPRLPQYAEAYGLRGACVAVYPMYKGVSQLVGMDVIKFSGESPADEFAAAQNVWGDYDFFFIHIKKTDSMGEDGNYEGKLKVIESVDAALPALLELKPDVLLVTGDHSTPVPMRAHSWHPVPLLLWSAQNALPDAQTQFGERACGLGGLGTIPATDIMPLALAHAGRLEKFGA
ncbi:MAG: 2,3-bisphosphoglycerate-independent phosphoglycerate mutase [Anaerolineales bacterium]|nr:2,3-bisphosphoglycerate-independent phosphoglycerate mutase [Anaerolineales bacterium]